MLTTACMIADAPAKMMQQVLVPAIWVAWAAWVAWVVWAA